MRQTMRAVVFDGDLRVEHDYPVPVLQNGQSLVKIRQMGICNTDLEIIQGYMGFSGILGHEFVGEVVDGDEQYIGKRVVGEINVADGSCDMCMRDIPSQCRDRTTVGIDRHNGAFAEYLALHTKNLHIVPDSVSDDEAVFVEPLAAALQVTEAVHISPRDHVVLIGAGKLGLLCAQVLRLTGADLSVIVRSEERAALVRSWGIRAVPRDEVANHAAQIVVDCTGNKSGFADALDIVEPRGTIVLKSTYADLPKANLTRIVVDEIRLIGSRCGPFDAALRLLASDMVDVQSLIHEHFALTDAIQAIARARETGVLKVLLNVD